MSARGFRSVFMVASCAGAALGCYLVSLRVASERAALEKVETRIVLAQRDIRLLQTEIGTRGRLAQLERWNVKVLALSAPSAEQILGGGFELARLIRPPHKDELAAPVVLASAPADAPRPQVDGAARHDAEDVGVPTSALLHQTSLTRDIPVRERAVVVLPKPPVAAPQPRTATSPATKAAAKPAAIASAKSVKPPVKAKSAAADPLAPLAGAAKKPKTLASATPLKASAKESARTP
ncbi:hypothetical protein [Sphingomonas sp.]|uniref:hypothetical protein n=1 Tax=Sphingomonas sp. TaxID=28214 RepID=UPI0017C2E9FB|nr:hypothetical protein [Sphingomonas sp.]MBA3510789.1 hypothetical protein [Sphingomonas sp.]